MKKSIKLFFFVILLLFSFFYDLKSGSLSYSITELINSLLGSGVDEQAHLILAEIRLPRVFTAILTGIALPVSGLLLQTLFENPLAGPYILGISSGASLGIAILLLGLSFIGISVIPGGFSLAFAGIIGAALVLLIILVISLKIRDKLTILIVGIFLGTGISAIVSLLQYFSSAPLLKKFVIWTMGSLDAVAKEQLWYFGAIILVLFVFTLFLSKFLDTIYLGEENAKTLGVNVKLLRILIFAVTGVLTGITTAFCGPIGFVGIAIPHIARMVFKTSKHIELIIFSALIGVSIMLFADAFSHSFNSQIIPINTITALIGIPVIFFVIFRNKRI